MLGNNLADVMESDESQGEKNKNDDTDKGSSFAFGGSNKNIKTKKSVNFEASKEASMDMDNIIHDRCKLLDIFLFFITYNKTESFYFDKSLQKQIYLIIPREFSIKESLN